jgi:hypothetical protein
MKRNILIAAGVLVLAAVVFLFSVYLSRRKENPEVLLKWLKKSKGDREEILMRLNMARGDVSTPMIRVFNDRGSNPKFRAEVLDLLFKKNLRAPDARVESTLVAALKDTSSLIRRQAVEGFALFTDSRLQPALVPFLRDPDTEVRRRVYTILTQGGELWDKFTPELRSAIVDSALVQKPLETDSMMAFLNRSIVGREIAMLCQQGLSAYLKSDLGRGDSLFQRALRLDTNNYRASMVLANYKVGSGDREEALRLARSRNTLAEMPRLASAPVIDGDPTDKAWEKAFSREQIVQGNNFAYRAGTGKAKLMLGYSGGVFYLSVICYEKDVSKLKITHGERDSRSTWSDDGVEVVLSPKFDKRHYCKFIITAGGCLYDRLGSNASVNFKCQYATRVFKDRGYWAMEFAVNGKDLDNNVFKPNDLWNICVIWNRFGCIDERDYFWFDYDDDVMALALFKP